MLRTAALCALLLWAAYAGAAWLTHDFQAWTAEGARRLEVARSPVAVPAVPIEGPDVTARTLDALLANGQDVTVVEFIYTNCETVCLSLGGVFQQMQAELDQAGAADPSSRHVRLLSVSFDPRRDTRQALQAYARRLRADPQRWRFVRPLGEAALQRLLADFRVVVVPAGRADFEHNAALLVVHRDGRLLRVFDLAEQQLALDYARHLAAAGAP